jgi:oligosaccharide reducing-end xylanase
MRKKVSGKTLACVLALGTASALQEVHAQTLSDGSGAYATGRYENLLREAGHSQAQIDARIDATYAQLFGQKPGEDMQAESVVFPAGKNAGGPLMYLTDWADHDVRTEGMSYGMMIAVQLGRKGMFDALWNWVHTYMYIADPSKPSHGYFAWSCKTDGTHNSEGPAPDGEEYFAMALLFAGNRWPGGRGIYDYHARAEDLLHTMVHHPVQTAQVEVRGQQRTMTIGPAIDTAHAMILFVPDKMTQPFTDPSYQLPGFYELFARWGPKEDGALWERAAETSRRFFVATTNQRTGLAPDYANFDGTPHASGFSQSGEFGYDAWRIASNWSSDWNWWRKAAAEQMLSDRIQTFFAGQGMQTYGPVFALDGKPLGATLGLTHEDHPAGLAGTNAVAGLAATDRERAIAFADALWATPIPSGRGRYYDGMLYLMSLMHTGGRFVIFKPAAARQRRTGAAASHRHG